MPMLGSPPFRAVLTITLCLQLLIPQGVSHAEEPHDSLPIRKEIRHVRLDKNSLHGVLVDQAGRGVPDAPVLIGQGGKLIFELRTNEQGRFVQESIAPGIYQVVTHAGGAVYHVWNSDAAPEGAKAGIIEQVDPKVARGAPAGSLLALLTNPIFLALLVAAAIAIPLAIDRREKTAS